MAMHGRKWYLPVQRFCGFVLSFFGPPLFRAMRPADDGLPEVGGTAKQLGVRTGPGVKVPDIQIDANGLIHPKSGGMSVATDSPEYLQPHRRPKEFGGTGNVPVYSLQRPIWGALRIRVDNPKKHHACVEPLFTCTLDDFNRELRLTRSRWKRVP